MKKISLIFAITVLVVFASMMLMSNRSGKLSPDTKAETGLSVVFDSPLQSSANLNITNDKGLEVNKAVLDKGGNRYNVALIPGVYIVTFTPEDNTLTPSSPSTVTVTEGKLSTLQLSEVIEYSEELE